jgi:hypothetical protein
MEYVNILKDVAPFWKALGLNHPTPLLLIICISIIYSQMVVIVLSRTQVIEYR